MGVKSRYALSAVLKDAIRGFESGVLPGSLPDTSAITWDGVARRLLAQAAFVHVQYAPDSVVTGLWNRLKKKGKAHREVQIACARKLLTVVWSVAKNDRPYVMDPEEIKAAREEADVLTEVSEEA